MSDRWEKWRARDPTSPHWYSQERLERYITAHVACDQKTGRERMVREFIADLRGIIGSAKQKAVLADTGMSRAALATLFEPEVRRATVTSRGCLPPAKSTQAPKALGTIGGDHLLTSFRAAGVHEASFKYQIAAGEADGLPWVVESAFGYCPEHARRYIEQRLASEALAEIRDRIVIEAAATALPVDIKVQPQSYLARHPDRARDDALAQIMGGQNGRDVLV